MNRAHFIAYDENAKPVSPAPWKGHGKGKGTMKRIAITVAVGFLLALSAYCAAETTTPPTSQPSKAETFLLVKVQGTIGEDFTAAKMKAAISEARTAKAAALVLSMDTPGGSVPDAEAIVNLIIENKDLRFIALVNKALSAGAAITLACKEIYVMETATIGAAVPYIPDKRGLPIGLPADVAEKLQSAWRAVCRKAADHGGHSSLLAEGMVDRDFAITKRIENGKVILERDGKGEVVKAAGRILTLTAKEAVACGLAKAVVPDVADLGAKLGMRQGGVVRGTTAEAPTAEAPTAEGPAQFYDLISDKIDALGLAGHSLTALGRKTADKEWDSWLKSLLSIVKGIRVSWALVLVEAKSPKGGTFEVFATPTTRRRPLVLVTANVRMAHKDVVASIPSGSAIILTGRVTDAYLEQYIVDGRYGHYAKWGGKSESGWAWAWGRIAIKLDDCVVGNAQRVQPVATPMAPATAPVDAEGEARKQLNLAENYRSAGLSSKALDILRSVIKDFPNTAAAKEAKEQVKQLEDEPKKAGKGS